ncbi:MAG: hypothetical protein ACKPB4_22050 [Sphaerospermopsis kisseleviana]
MKSVWRVWIPRLLNYLAKLSGIEYALVVAIPKKEEVSIFASPGAVLWVSKSWTDAVNTFPAAVQAAQLQRRTFAARLASGGVDCSLEALLSRALQRTLMTTLLGAVVDRNKHPVASTTTEALREVVIVEGGRSLDGWLSSTWSAVQEYPWFPEDLEYESLDTWSAPQLEKLLIGMVQVRRLGPLTARLPC